MGELVIGALIMGELVIGAFVIGAAAIGSLPAVIGADVAANPAGNASSTVLWVKIFHG
jgi:hypothetical protein